MSALGEHVRLYLGEQETVRADHDLPHGLVCVRSVRAPDKQTPNEDAAAVIQVGEDSLVLAVADGVGGTPAGREASNATVQTLCRVLSEQPPEGAPRLRPAILDAVEEANKTVLQIARGAATTLVIAELVSTRLRSYHVGDSELLTVGQRGRIKARVVPHSPTGFAVEAGLMDEDEAVQHDQRHVIFNVIGAQDMRVEIGPALQLAVHDTVLLASDGLLDNLFLDEIVQIIRMGPLSAGADRLVVAALARMTGDGRNGPCKPDDLTVVLFRPHTPKK
ncbi:MAG TPA: protein phosphatase 2C domain-containing protein [Gammaproteobacteria bacterium]|nr:protein phosphatase 2C domain-containing protein [Gammaproteobacteria bacterium]